MHLTEMPRVLGGRLDKDEWGTFYHSHSTLERRFDKLFSVQVGRFIVDFYRSKFNKLQYVGCIPSDIDPIEDEVIFTLEFKPKTTLYAIPSEFKNAEVKQVTRVSVKPEWYGRGLASFVYSYLVEDGSIILSDLDQYKDGTMVWKRLARKPNRHVYLVVKNSQLYKQDGIPIEYDGTNIPNSYIWTGQSDYSGQSKILCLTKEPLK